VTSLDVTRFSGRSPATSSTSGTIIKSQKLVKMAFFQKIKREQNIIILVKMGSLMNFRIKIACPFAKDKDSSMIRVMKLRMRLKNVYLFSQFNLRVN
jgi:hypothetical protein